MLKAGFLSSQLRVTTSFLILHLRRPILPNSRNCLHTRSVDLYEKRTAEAQQAFLRTRSYSRSQRKYFYTKLFTTTRNLKMASDEDYMSFLDKANQDPSAGQAKSASSGKQEFKTTDSGVQVPAVLKSAVKDAFYTSDADEPFVPVCLKWDEDGKGLPDEEEFAKLVSHPNPSSAEIEIQDPADWDSQGQYVDLIDAVRNAGKGNDVRVYKISKDGTRVEYWVVTTEGKGKNAKLVGVKALAIES